MFRPSNVIDFNWRENKYEKKQQSIAITKAVEKKKQHKKNNIVGNFDDFGLIILIF